MLKLTALKYEENGKNPFYSSVPISNQWYEFTIDRIAAVWPSSNLINVFDEDGWVVRLALSSVSLPLT